MNRLKMKTTATLLIALFLASMLSVMVLGLNPTVDHIEWLPPLTKHDEFGFKDGSTLPIKFRLEDNLHNFVSDPNVVVTVNDEFGYLFSDDFETEDIGDPASQWSVVTGTWLIEQEDGNQVYSQNQGPGGRVTYACVDGPFTDGIVEARVKSISGTAGQHIAWRSDGDFNSNYYWFGWAFDSDRVRWGTFVGGTGTQIGSITKDFSSGVWYTLKVVALGSHFDMYLDGELIFSVDDTTFSSGSVGFHCGGHTHFDDFKVGKIWASFSINDGLETPLKYELFSDGFEDPVFTGEEWTTIAGDWVIEAGVYSQNEVTDNNAQRWALAGDYEWDNYLFEVKAKGIEGHYSGYDEHTWVGLVFRAKDDTHFYEYYFRTSEQDIIVVKHAGGIRTVISGPVSFTCANGNWYTLKVIAEGNSFRFYADGVEITELAFTDTTNPFMTGKVGLYVWDGTHAHFDDVIVLGYQYQCDLHTKGYEMPAGNYMITVSGDDYSFSYPFMLFEGGKAKGKP